MKNHDKETKIRKRNNREQESFERKILNIKMETHKKVQQKITIVNMEQSIFFFGAFGRIVISNAKQKE